jgi:hypothetical protein
MDWEQAERRFQELQAQRDRGALDENQFRLEVAKLLFQDAQGVFWMMDADEGRWFCNHGEGWEPGDPHAEPATVAQPAVARRRRRGQRLALSLILVTLLGLVAVILWQQWVALPGKESLATPMIAAATESIAIQVVIASPADRSRVALGQEVAVEATLHAPSGLQAADRVEIQVNGQTVASRSLRSTVQSGQTSLPLSQPWLPTALGECQLAVVVHPAQGGPLGQASITLYVAETADEALPEPACTPDATFVADVTIRPGTAFRPGAQMEKVWRVRNSGTCAWGMGYELVRVRGSMLGAPDRVAVPFTAAGEPADLAVPFQAPAQAGTITNTWQLQSPDGVLFGPLLELNAEVEAEAEASVPPDPPANVRAVLVEGDGSPADLAVQLTWLDRSENEDAFRVYREDVDASIGLVPADAQLFVDRTVACGRTYRYGIVAFNAAGASPLSDVAEVSLPPCPVLDAPPSLVLTVVPTQVIAGGPITVVFQATDDLGVVEVIVHGERTGNPDLDAGQIIACTDVVCAGTWPITQTAGISTTWTIVATARDSSGQESEPARVQVLIRPAE